MYHRKQLTSVLLILSVVLSLCHGAAIFPKSLRTQSGSPSPSTSVSALAERSTSAAWNQYVEFDGSSTPYSGTFTFDVSGIDLSTVSTYSLDTRYKGPAYSAQVWEFSYYMPSSGTWVLAGDNKDAKDWKWTDLSFCGTESFSSLVKDGSIQVRYSSARALDSSDLDYLAIITSASGAPTNKPTTAPTAAPTAAPTTRPTSAPTAAPTTKPTSAPTTAPTTKPTSAPTAAPTTKPTSAPTVKPTTAPTTRPTSAPTSAPTSSPTSAPAPGGRMCPTGQVWAPQPGTTWQWQLTGTIDQSLDVQMYDIDLFDNTAATIASLHAQGRAVICYFSTQYENWRPDAASWPASVLGSNLDDWPGERYADIRSSIVRGIMTARLDLALTKGCDGVEPDNVDSYANKNGLSLTAADQLDFNRFMATEAHKRGLSVGLKNDLDQVSALQSSYDWALNEQCNEYGECSGLSAFTAANKAVFGTEYTGKVTDFCPAMNADKFSWLLKDLDLGAKVTQCCSSASGGCKKAPYTCKTYTSKRSLAGEEVEQLVAEATPEAAFAAEQLAEAQHSSASTSLPVVAIVIVSALALML